MDPPSADWRPTPGIRQPRQVARRKRRRCLTAFVEASRSSSGSVLDEARPCWRPFQPQLPLVSHDAQPVRSASSGSPRTWRRCACASAMGHLAVVREERDLGAGAAPGRRIRQQPADAVRGWRPNSRIGRSVTERAAASARDPSRRGCRWGRCRAGGPGPVHRGYQPRTADAGHRRQGVRGHARRTLGISGRGRPPGGGVRDG